MRDRILQAIRATAAENGGKPLGIRRFEQRTGFRYADWFGRYWTKWGDAVAEAGLTANELTGRIEDDTPLALLAGVVRELGRLPVKGDLRLRRGTDGAFPNDKVFERQGSKAERTERLRSFCGRDPAWADVLALLPPPAPSGAASPYPAARALPTDGVVYLVKLGRYHKIGRTKALGRREYELNLQLPAKVEVVHQIATDDPEGIEAYWHRRLAAKRTNGEWFQLDATDVAAFRRRRFQ